ncbi:SagB/ThcOx family dehydrogenase [Nonomuraea sp. NN258]|uniref:SagB/ThcOx family dehydrogenase n=1 Tax=Nonomuraea antri TaxID=2730852 RepID=UPI00156969B9|nr:SagB family peptide dehydrogenase [Nonomuraea antri]NRQ34211.1 SagB/ThcOx family dehydrogenase [Nonomuraea antri]
MPGGQPAPPFPLWSFREDVYIEPLPEQGIVMVHSRWEDAALPLPAPAVLEAMRRMGLGPISLDNVITDDADRRELAELLDGMQHLVVRSFGLDPEQPLISVVPLTQQARFRLPERPVSHPVRLSRFAVIRTDGNHYVIESPLSLHRVILHRADAMAQIGTLIRPAVPAAHEPDSVISYLLATGMVVQAEGGDPFQPVRFAEDRDPALVAWSPLDLMFHTRSTLGRHDQDFGATYPLGEQWAVEPVVKPVTTEGAVALPRPKWEELVATDPPLTTAVEASEHTRRYDEQPLTIEELGALLYRTARVRALVGSSQESSTTSTSDRPYTSSGSCYELELYVTVDRCVGLRGGVYHYDPLGHRLEPLPADPATAGELLEMGRVAADLDGTPPALITITARFRRLSWKYNGLSYSLVLKNVGALTQTLSLVSTAMGLAACRVDSGDTDLAPRAFGLDWRVESSVGGFVVGHRARPEYDGSPERHAVNDADWALKARQALA